MPLPVVTKTAKRPRATYKKSIVTYASLYQPVRTNTKYKQLSVSKSTWHNYAHSCYYYIDIQNKSISYSNRPFIWFWNTLLPSSAYCSSCTQPTPWETKSKWPVFRPPYQTGSKNSWVCMACLATRTEGWMNERTEIYIDRQPHRRLDRPTDPQTDRDRRTENNIDFSTGIVYNCIHIH